MKRYIKCNYENSNYPIIINFDGSIDDASLESQVRDVLEPASAYIAQVEVNLSGLASRDLRVKSKLRVAQLRVSTPTKNLEKSIAGLLRYAQGKLDDWIDSNRKAADAQSKGITRISGLSLVSRLVKEKFGYSPSFSYSDTGKLQYMFVDLPFAEGYPKFIIYQSQAEACKDAMDSFLDEIKSKYDIRMWWNLPIGGFVRRACWEIRVLKDQWYAYDSTIGDYVKL